MAADECGAAPDRKRFCRITALMIRLLHDDNLPDDGDILNGLGRFLEDQLCCGSLRISGSRLTQRTLKLSGVFSSVPASIRKQETANGPEGCARYMGKNLRLLLLLRLRLLLLLREVAIAEVAIAAEVEAAQSRRVATVRPKAVALNLLLIASALFFTVSLAGRAAGGRNGNRS